MKPSVTTLLPHAVRSFLFDRTGLRARDENHSRTLFPDNRKHRMFSMLSVHMAASTPRLKSRISPSGKFQTPLGSRFRSRSNERVAQMQKLAEAVSERLSVRRLIEAYESLPDDTSEEQFIALEYIAAMVEAGMSWALIDQYAERNRRLVLDER